MTVERPGIVLGPGEGHRVPSAGTGGNVTGDVLIKASGEETAGAYTLRESMIAAGQAAARLHIHHRMEEGFYILEGELAFQLGERRLTAVAGSFVLVPRGVVHTFANPSARPARALLLFSPPGFERFFVEMAALRQASPTGEVDLPTLHALARHYDTEYLETPALI